MPDKHPKQSSAPQTPLVADTPKEHLEAAISDLGENILNQAETAIETDVAKISASDETRDENPSPTPPQQNQTAAEPVPHPSDTASAETVPTPKSARQGYRDLAFGAPSENTQNQESSAAPPIGPVPTGPADTSALNQASVQAVEFQNQEIKDYAPTMIVTPPDQMIGQAAGLAAQASAQYFDSMTKIVMASQSVMLKKMAEDLAEGHVLEAAGDGLVIAETELLLAGAMAVAAAGGAMEAESASFGIAKINESVQARQAQAAKASS